MADEEIKKKLEKFSNAYYNRGLDRAQIRDLSGAADMLRTSLQLNKQNIQARNLLGLVYFEMGEAVAALSEWVISKNFQPEDNIASDFIDKLKANQNKLAVVNRSIKTYNSALQNCRNGNEDVAAINLRKVVTQNPTFIKAHHLLALIYMKQGKYTRARKILRRVIKIDRTNPTTLRYIREIDEQTGTVTRIGRREKKEAPEREVDRTVVPALGYRQSSPFIGLINIIIGIAVGLLAAWFLIAPSVRQSTNTAANKKIVEYSNTMATQQDQITSLQDQVEESNSTVTSAQQQITDAQETSASNENLLKAYVSYQNGSYSDAAQTLESVDSSKLSSDSKEIYDEIYGEVENIMFKQLKNSGMTSYENGDYQSAITDLEKAMEIKDDDYTTLAYLGLAYRDNGNSDKAIEIFQKIIELFPDTRKASSAQAYIDQMTSSDNGTEGTDTSTDNAGGDGEDSTTGDTTGG
ncbi:MAG: tetratricopeptide repeat protein [Bilifractor sp.]|jgi:tetratricopeptide (TPR) repeat protein